MDFTVTKCFGCQAAVLPLPGNFYCGACVAKQEAEHEAERIAFDEFHRFADACARRSS